MSAVPEDFYDLAILVGAAWPLQLLLLAWDCAAAGRILRL